MAVTTILEEQSLAFTENPMYGGLYTKGTAIIPLVAGETYTIEWDGARYESTAVYYEALGGNGVGNAGLLGLGENTGEPFAIGTTDAGSLLFTSDTSASHTVAIYQDVDNSGETEERDPNDVQIMNYVQDKITYENVPKVWLSHPDSTDENQKLVPFTYGEAVSKSVEPDFSSGDMQVPIQPGELVTELTVVQPPDLTPDKIAAGEYIAGVGPGTHRTESEEATVELSMAEGNQEVHPSNGKFLSKVTVLKPATLQPKNIAKGVDIGGVVGTHIAKTEKKYAYLDLEFGDQEVTPSSDDIAMSKVIIVKPSTLVPGNIVKDVEIAGVTGTFEGSASEIKASPGYKAVNFYDIFGNIVYSYKRSEAAQLTELPEVPELEGYDANGWNQTLDQIKGSVAFIDVAPRYTKDGNPAIIAVLSVKASQSIPLYFYSYNTAGTASVHWGDGSSTDVTVSTQKTLTATHTYTKAGIYVVGLVFSTPLYLGAYKYTGTSRNGFVGGTAAGYNRVLQSLTGFFYLAKCATHSDYCLRFAEGHLNDSYNFYNCYSLLAHAGSDNQAAKSYCFYNCYAMRRLALARSSTNVGFMSYGMEDSYSVTSSNAYYKNTLFRRIVITGTSPGYLDGITTTDLQGIYVPDDVVATYKANSYWSTYASYIKPLSEYPDY